MNGRKRRHPSNCDAASTSLSLLEPVGLRVSPRQLVQLWNFDNECANRFMKGCPLRTCSVDGAYVDGDDDSDPGLSDVEMTLFKEVIKDTWQEASTQFEVLQVKGQEELGYRLFLKKNLLSKVVIREAEAVKMGWFARVPAALATAHVYLRSYAEPNIYLGGPISYSNWSSRESVHARHAIAAGARNLCMMWTVGGLCPGAELVWNYGHRSQMPFSGTWFKEECCSITSKPCVELRHRMKSIWKQNIYRDMCVLCGFKFSVDNKETRVQYKPHLAGSHADFFGSSWDGTGEYKNEPINPNVLFVEVDTCNFILSHLRQMNWRLLPACQLFSQQELEDFPNDETLMACFRGKFESLKKAGTLVLRGCEVPSKPCHFKPVKARPWKVLTWGTADGTPPPKGRYAVPSNLKESHELSLHDKMSAFCSKNLA